MEFTTIKISNWGQHPWGEITFKPDCTEIKELVGGRIINQKTYCPDDTSKEENLIFPTSFVNFFKILSSSSFGHQFWFNNGDGSTFMRYIYQNLVVPFTKLEETTQQLREEVARKDAEIAELKQQAQTKEVIMRQIIETLRMNFAMEIEKKDKDCKQQLQEKDELLEKDEELLKKHQKQLERNNCRMVNLNQRIVNLTKQTEERENLCNELTKNLEEKDEDFEDLKNEAHEYYEETKRQSEAIEYLKITNQEIGRLNYLLILGTSEKKINDFSPEF